MPVADSGYPGAQNIPDSPGAQNDLCAENAPSLHKLVRLRKCMCGGKHMWQRGELV